MLLDTSGLLCYLMCGRLNAEAVKALSTLHGSSSLTATFWLSLCRCAEPWARSRRVALQFVEDVMDNPSIDLVWVDEDIHSRRLRFCKDGLDKTYSLCDAVSFLLMRERAITEALTTDRHFEQEGFVRLLEP